MQREELDAAIGRSDPFEYWRAEARLHSSELGLAAGTTDAALDVVIRTLGRDWLDAELASRKTKKFSLMRIDSHPVAGWIDMPSPHSIAELVELAAYFRALETTDGFVDVVPMLRVLGQFVRAR